MTPKLRLRTFEGDWVKRALRDVLILKPRPIKMDDAQVYSLVTIKRRYGGIVHRGNYLGSDVQVKSQFLLEENDFAISKRQISHNACGLVPKELAGSIVSNEYSVFVPQDGFDIKYFNYFCQLPKVSRTFFLSSTGVHIEKLIFKVEDWFKWRFYFPTLPEQEEIATILSAVDEKIQQLTRKKELLEKYKKGVMQQLFSGKLRFKDENGKPYPKWEEKQLRDVCTFHKGRGVSKGDVAENGKLECILYGELYTTYNELIENVVSRTNLPAQELFLSEYNDVIIPSSGETQLDIATASCVLKSGVALGGDLNVIRTTMNGIFLSFYLNTEKRKDIARLAQGSSVVHLYSSQLQSLIISVPCLSEQKQIADFLSGLETAIKSVTKQISLTQTFKKGLLQQMFV